MNEFTLALNYLTVLPINPTAPLTHIGRAARFFPLVGFLLGVLLTSVHFVFATFFNPLLASALTVSAWAVLTGGKHLAGLAHSCEGIFTAASERRLEVMRGPSINVFGVTGLSLFLIAKVTALATLPSGSVLLAVYGATLLARWLMVMAAQRPVARTGGIVDELAHGLTRETLVLAALLPAAFMLFGVVEVRVLIAGALAYISAWLIGGLAQSRLGGITDEILGLTVEVAELVFLLTFAAQITLVAQ